MSFVLKCSSFTWYVAFLIAIRHDFAFNYTSLQISCVLLELKLMPMQISKLLALAIINANAYKCV